MIEPYILTPAPDHELKMWPEYFQPVIEGRKTFEVRKPDRNYKVGDRILLREWDPTEEKYTGRTTDVIVKYILTGPLAPDGLVIMSIELDKWSW